MSHPEEPEQNDRDVEMAEADSSQKSKRKRNQKPSSTISQFTIRNPPWSYIHLSLIFTSSNVTTKLDALTAHLHLRAALSQFLGLHGTAIPIDILKLEANDVYIRVPREDASALVIAVGSWVGKNGEGWMVRHSGCWGPALQSDGGAELFK